MEMITGDIPYLVKLNSKSNLVKKDMDDPRSQSWYTVDDVVRFKENSGLKIVGVGYTVYSAVCTKERCSMKQPRQSITRIFTVCLPYYGCIRGAKSVADENRRILLLELPESQGVWDRILRK